MSLDVVLQDVVFDGELAGALEPDPLNLGRVESAKIGEAVKALKLAVGESTDGYTGVQVLAAGKTVTVTVNAAVTPPPPPAPPVPQAVPEATPAEIKRSQETGVEVVTTNESGKTVWFDPNPQPVGVVAVLPDQEDEKSAGLAAEALDVLTAPAAEPLSVDPPPAPLSESDGA